MLERTVVQLSHGTGSGSVFPGIDGVRAIALLLVLVFHVHGFGAGGPPIQVLGLNLVPWLATGSIGVDLFFVLSGFLLMLPWTKSYYCGGRPPRIGEYYRRRILRIVPAYYLHLAALFLVLVPGAHSVFMLLSPLGFANIATHLTFTHYLTPWTSASLGVNGALWTLTIEASFYILLPLVAPLFLGVRCWLGLAAALLVAQTWRYLSFNDLYGPAVHLAGYVGTLSHDPETIKRFLALQFPGQAFYFAVGMALTNVFYRAAGAPSGPGLPSWIGSGAVLASLAGLLWVGWLLSRAEDYWHSHWHYTWHVLAAVILGGLVLSAALSNAASIRFLGTPALRLVGLISYSMYLWHFPVIFFAKRYLAPWAGDPVRFFWFMLVICGAATLAIGLMSYRYVELPFMRRREPTRMAVGTADPRAVVERP